MLLEGWWSFWRGGNFFMNYSCCLLDFLRNKLWKWVAKQKSGRMQKNTLRRWICVWWACLWYLCSDSGTWWSPIQRKHYWISAHYECELSVQDEWIVTASDGFWSVVGDEKAHELVMTQENNSPRPLISSFVTFFSFVSWLFNLLKNCLNLLQVIGEAKICNVK